MYTYPTTIEIGETEVDAVIELDDYNPGVRGARDSLGGVRGAGPPLEPDDPEGFETVRVLAFVGPSTDGEMNPIELDEDSPLYPTSWVITDAIEAGIEHIRGDHRW